MRAPRYTRQKAFTQDDGDQTDHGALEAELDRVAQTTQGLRHNLAQLQREDGALAAGIVQADALAPHFKADLITELSGEIESQLSQAQTAARAATTAAQSAQLAQGIAEQAQTQASTAAQAAQLNATSSAQSATQALTAREDSQRAQAAAQDSAQQAEAGAVLAQEGADHAQAQSQIATTVAHRAQRWTRQAEHAQHEAAHEAQTARTAAELARKTVEDATQLGIPSDDSISPPKLVAHAVTTAKIAPAAVTAEQLSAQAVTTEKLAPEAVIQHLGYTPLDAAQKGQPQGVATLAENGSLPEEQLQGAFPRGTGYQRLPGGLILQWGFAEQPNPLGQDITYPIVFPQAVCCLVATGGNGARQWEDTINVQSRDNAHFSLFCAFPRGNASVPSFWLALGC
jgi:hypothetical protein